MSAGTRGRFLTLEGLEGVGKTSNLEAIVGALRARGIEPLVTREPGGTPLGERLRSLVLHDGFEMLPRTELLLVAAARLEHVERVVEPALAAGTWVVSDRYLDASVAYQGGGRGLGAAHVADFHASIGVHLEPDLTLLLDVEPDVGLGRVRERGEPDRIERESLGFFERARAAYLERAIAAPARMAIVDASRPLDVVRADVAARVRAFVARALDGGGGENGASEGGDGSGHGREA